MARFAATCSEFKSNSFFVLAVPRGSDPLTTRSLTSIASALVSWLIFAASSRSRDSRKAACALVHRVSSSSVRVPRRRALAVGFARPTYSCPPPNHSVEAPKLSRTRTFSRIRPGGRIRSTLGACCQSKSTSGYDSPDSDSPESP